MKVLRFLRAYLSRRTSLSVIDTRLKKLEGDKARLMRYLQSDRKALVGLQSRLEERLAVTQRHLEEHERLRKSYEEECKGLRERIDVLENITVPGLTSSSISLEKRWEAQTAILVRQKVGAQVNDLQ